MTFDHPSLVIRPNPSRPQHLEAFKNHFASARMAAHLTLDHATTQWTKDPALVAWFSRQGCKVMAKTCNWWHCGDNDENFFTNFTIFAEDILSNGSCTRGASDVGPLSLQAWAARRMVTMSSN